MVAATARLNSFYKMGITCKYLFLETTEPIRPILCMNDCWMVLDKYPKSTIWVAGDFNLPDIDWLTNTFSGNRYLNEINQTLLQIEEELGYHKLSNFQLETNPS